jgi:NAD(P)-dependent dehydrogenase (short-subunit alcohol dehydrogenase family)
MNTLAIEGSRSNILVNAIVPMAATRMTEDVAPQELLDKLAPEHVSPLVTHLLSDELSDTAGVYIVGGGQINRVQQFQNKGVTFASPPSVDEVAARWGEINDMSEAAPAKNPLG